MDWKGYGIIVAAFFTISIAYSVRYGYGMLLPGMVEALRISKTEAGLISSAYFCAYTACSPILGAMSDRVSARLLLTAFTGVLASATFLMAYVDTVGMAAVVFALAGVGHAACWAPVVGLVQKWVPDGRRGAALAVATTGSGIGIAVWSLWLPVVMSQYSYREGWMQMGLFGLFVTLLNLALVRNPHVQARKGADLDTTPGPSTISYPRIMRSKKLWLVGVSYACVGFSILVPLTFLGVYATEILQLQMTEATSFFTVIAGAALFGKLSLGILSDRLGRLVVMMTCGLCIGGGCFGMVQFSSLLGKYLAVVVIGIGFGAVWPVYAAAAVDFFPKHLAGGVVGIWTVFMGLGSLFSPILCGITIDNSGAYTQAFHLGGAVALLSVLFLLPLRANPGIVGRRSASLAT